MVCISILWNNKLIGGAIGLKLELASPLLQVSEE